MHADLSALLNGLRVLKAHYCLSQGSRDVCAIRFAIPGIKTDMKANRKLVSGTVGVGILGVLLGGGEPFASGGTVMEAASSAQGDVRPAIDRATPMKTERAVFALG